MLWATYWKSPRREPKVGSDGWSVTSESPRKPQNIGIHPIVSPRKVILGQGTLSIRHGHPRIGDQFLHHQLGRSLA